ncbi:MAG: DNA cytosine methyltransferase [Actinobacteria bacterium]|nr:DNA cytosine methyltransferase [Actinomycetota bacterium]
MDSDQRILDLFSSVGGLALGAKVATQLLGGRATFEGAVDTDRDALRVHEHNLLTRRVIHESVLELVDLPISEDAKTGLLRFKNPTMLPLGQGFDGVSLLIGGPPCQGHSTLNNKTRSDDPKNRLMLTMPGIAVALGINAVVIENVPNVVNDANRVVQKTHELFVNHGYHVEQGVIAANQLGWPQTRKRFFMVARLDKAPIRFDAVVHGLRMPPKNVGWVLEDLLDFGGHEPSIMDTSPKMSLDNVRRVDYLFDQDLYDLPDDQRPKCHQNGHTYPAVYGRMHWDEPAPTITGGFLSPGRGRFVHPRRRRVLTPHEAARIQGFPDWFDFVSPMGEALNRSMLAKWIGDAVPSMLATAAVLSAIG